MSRRYLVTGAAGFIGSTLVAKLARDEPESSIVALDSLTDYYDVAVKRTRAQRISELRNVDFIRADLNEVDLQNVVAGVDVIFHLAGQPGVRLSWGADFNLYASRNVLATQALLEATKAAAPRARLVYASSSSVYGDAESYPTSEDATPQPRSPYGVTKLAAEHLCNLYAHNFGLDIVSLRFFTVYGPEQRPDMAFYRFIASAIQGEVISVYGDGTQIREFTHVEDIVRAAVAASLADVPTGLVVNLSGGESASVNQVLSILGEIHGEELRVSRLARADGDVWRTGGDRRRAEEYLGWRPEIGLQEGLASEYHWLEKLLSSRNA